LIEHWDGTSWNVVPSPRPAVVDNNLYSVAAVSANDVWAVGYEVDFSNYRQTLIEHWDGSSWSAVPSPNPSNQADTVLKSVTAVSANDVWAVGYYVDSTGEYTVIEHWDGTSWSVVSSPNPGPSDNALASVAAASANDVWAVGLYEDSSLNEYALVEHWNGSAWSVVPSPDPGSGYVVNPLTGVAAVSASDVWAVGSAENFDLGRQSLIERWDGGAWNIVLSPNPGLSDNAFSSVAVVSSSDVWAVGYYVDSLGYYRNLIEHWDGSSWNVVPNPNP
jgi:hypothetical protein